MAEKKIINTELQPIDKLLDSSGDAGTSGQILSSTGSGTNWIAAGGSGTVTGSGTDNYIPLWNGTTALDDSIMFQTGTNQVKLSSAGNAYFTIRTATTTGETVLEFADSSGASGALTYNHTGNSLAFKVNGSEKMRVTNTGSVGIGTSTPGTNLDIQGTAAQSLRVKSDDSASIIIDSDGDNSGPAGAYLHYRDTGATKWTLYKETNNDFYLFNGAASTYPIHAKAGGDIVLMEDGNKLGVGASTPARTLHVGGPGGSSGGIMISPTSGDAEIQFQDSGTTNAYITLDDGTGDMNFRDDSATVLTVDFSNERVGV